MNAQTSLLPAEQPAPDELTTSMLQNAPVLRALLTRQAWDSVADLARAVERDKDNLRKSLAVLEEDGAIVRPDKDKAVFHLTDFGRRAVQGFDFAEGRVALPTGFVIRTHAQLRPHPLNPRKDWDSEEAVQALDEMRESVVLRGIRYPLEIRAGEDGVDYIISGERRWKGLGLAIDDGDMPADYPIVCQVKDVDNTQHLILALEENIQRRNLSHLEEARAYAYLRDVEKWGTDKIAETFGGLSRKVVQNKLRLLEPKHAELARKVESGEITYHQALQAMIEPKAPQGEGLFGGDLPQQKKGEEQKPLELTPKQALIVIELADRCEKHPHPLFDGYTRVAQLPTSGDGLRLTEKGIIAGRSGMGQAFAKVMLYKSNAKQWLTDNGFYEDRGELLHKARTAIVGEEKAHQAEADGRYVTEWLNVDDAEVKGATTLATETPPEPELDAVQLCALVEIVFKANEEQASANSGEKPVAVLSVPPMTHPLLRTLCWGGYITPLYTAEYFPCARYSDSAIALLDRLDINPLTKPRSLKDARLGAGVDDLRADMLVMQEKYLTDALNVIKPEPEPEIAEEEEAQSHIVDDDGWSPLTSGAQAADSYGGEAAADGPRRRPDPVADEGRFAPPVGAAPAPAKPAHVVPPSSQNLQASADFNRMVADRLNRDLANGKPHWGDMAADACADVAIGFIEDGDLPGAGAAMAALVQRAGHLAAGPHLMRALARHIDAVLQGA